jgi:lipocalin
MNYTRLIQIVIFSLLPLCTVQAGAQSEDSDIPDKNRTAQVDPVDTVDLQRYAGRWYELAATPNFFTIGCYCVTATYGVESPTELSVFNACNKWRARGRLDTIVGTAEVKDPSEPGKLVVTLDGPPFPAPYWIVDLVDDPNDPAGPYRFAAVSGPDADFIFMLARVPRLETDEDLQAYHGIIDRLTTQGFPVDRLDPTPQPARCDYDAQHP